MSVEAATAEDFARRPMEGLRVRPMRFDLSDVQQRNPVWSRSSPQFAVFINALAVHSPYFERFLGAVCRQARPRIRDPRLLADVSTLIGQEAHHAFNFIEMNRFLAGRYPKVAALDARARADFERALAKDSLRRQVGFVAGYETFTFLAGMVVLGDYDALMGDADPVIRSMWIWHQVEEVEHGAVAFELYRALFGEHEWYRKWMVVAAFAYITRQAAEGYLHMCKVEGELSTPRRAWRALHFFVSFALRLVRLALPALSSRYHPRSHPMVNHLQSPIAIGWRRWYANGADVSALEDAEISELRALGERS
jgi:predicted metal-dependent hydrolase